MSNTAKEIAYLVDILPEQDQDLVYEITKKMVLAWDPDFTKLTPFEKHTMDIAEIEIAHGDYVEHNKIEW